jgi:hypothetical protein
LTVVSDVGVGAGFSVVLEPSAPVPTSYAELIATDEPAGIVV